MSRKPIQATLALLVVFFLLTATGAQQQTTATQSPEDRIALYQALLDLTNPWTVMCIAAHPDDEDGTSLIVMRRKYGAHTVSLFTTFGEGGQNAIGPELYEEMGAIRARETMAASEIQGSEPHFLGLKDFGFSKSADEAFKFWGHEEALRRMVLQFRKLRPDVIITNHNSTGGHGHHQATGRLELEAFDAAADPKRFPEQLKDGVTTWQVQRLFLRVGFGNRAAEQNEGTVTIDPNERDPIRGTVFAEEALRALQKHATQGPWPKTFADMLRFRNSQDGKLALTRYRLVREAKGAAPLPKDSHNFLDGLRTSDSFAKELEMPTIDGKPLVEFRDNRSKVLEQLLKYAHNRFSFAADWSNHERLSSMKRRIQRATLIAAGVSVQIKTPASVVTPNSAHDLTVRISNAGTQVLSVFGCSSEIPSLREPTDPAKNQGGPTGGLLESWDNVKGGSTFERHLGLIIPAKAPVNVPLSSHLYEPTGLGLQVRTHCAVGFGQRITDRLSLEESTTLNVGPAVEITDVQPGLIVLLPTASAEGARRRPAMLDLVVTLVNHSHGNFKGEVISGSVPNLIVSQALVEFPPRTSATVKIRLRADLAGTHSPAGHLIVPTSVSLSLKKAGSSETVTTRAVPLVRVNAKVAHGLRVGYIRGFDYSLPNALNGLGVESKELSVDEVKTADLQKYTSIIVDNRVYESQPDLIASNQKLLDYANAGGTLIVFYHKSNEWNPDERRNRPQQLAPYKLILGGERITDETAPLTFLEPEHPLLNVPNKMGQEDFANWIQERGLYYPREWDPQYHALLQSNDPGEAPLKGGLLVAAHGRGHYIYSSMVWYRQLRGGLPGAYRMLANMISYGQAEGKSKK